MKEIRKFVKQDYPVWLPLWEQNTQNQLGERVTQSTWTRITDPTNAVHGLGVFDGGDLQGFLHYVLHPVTGSIAPVCYMQDLFIAPSHRRKGLAQLLIEHLAMIGRDAGWNRIYWLAEEKNMAAQTLYKKIGVRLDFSLHVLPLALNSDRKSE